jgi:hypothetical protein
MGFRGARGTIFVELPIELAEPNGVPAQDGLIRLAGPNGIQIRPQELRWVGIKPINPPICLTLNLDEAAFLKIGKVLGDLYLGLA